MAERCDGDWEYGLREWEDAVKRIGRLLLTGLATLAVGCGGASSLPHANLMDQTTAGKNRCTVAKSHDRPFVIEWDATDLTEFEAKAKRDMVFVRYDGCELKVLSGCMDEGVAGRYGAYYPPETTSGNVEGIDIKNEAELYAQLPLGAASLEARVSSGDQLHLAYYVAGVARATREVIYKGDFESNARCKDATHFVAGYSLGAFELTSGEEDKVAGGAGLQGVASAGASREHARTTLKRGGNLHACSKDALSDASQCRVPIRLTLRAIEAGTRPASAASSSSPTAGAAPVGSDAVRLRQSAMDKVRTGDGAGCLADLDRAAQLDPPGDAGQDSTRATCEMRAGKCEAGKKRYRAALVAQGMQQNMPDSFLETAVHSAAAENCPIEQLSPEERVNRAVLEMSKAVGKQDHAACVEAGKAAVAQLKQAPAATRKTQAPYLMTAVQCAVAGHRCEDAKSLLGTLLEMSETPAAQRENEVKLRLANCR